METNIWPTRLSQDKKIITPSLLFNMAVVLLIVFSQYNTAKWGASFSYILIPFLLVLFGFVFSNLKIRNSSLLIFLLYFVYFLSTLLSPYVELGRDIITFALLCIFYVLITSKNYSNRDIQLFLLVYIIVAFTASINICYQWLNGNFIQAWVRRSTFVFLGVKKDPNYSMAYIAPAMVLSVYIFLNSKKKIIKAFCLINSLVTFFACICASTRAGMLAIIIPIVLLILITKHLKTKTKLFVLLLLGITIILGFTIILRTYNEYALKRFFEDEDGSGRLSLWRAALESFKMNPIIGGGMNSGSYFALLEEGNASHSILVDIISDSGILGILFLFIFFVVNCLKTKKKNFEFQIVIVSSALIPMMFINGFNTTTFYFPIILLTILSTYNSTSNNDYRCLFRYDEWRLFSK